MGGVLEVSVAVAGVYFFSKGHYFPHDHLSTRL